MSIFDQARNVLKTLKQGKANPILQGIYDLPGSTKILAQRAPQAVNQLVMDPRVAGNFARNAPKTANIKVPGMQSVANFSANTAQSFGQGLQDMAMGYNKVSSKPGAFNKLQGSAQMIAGAGKTVVPFTLPFQVANAVTSAPQINNMFLNPVQRFSAGVLRGMSGDQKLAENIKNKNDINLNLFGTKIGIDPAETAGQMIGFVKNPVNKQLFKLTNSVFPTGSLAAKGTNLKKWLAVTGLRGGVENILLDLAKVPENATNEQKIAFMLKTAGIGSVTELGGRGMLDVSGAVGNKVLNNKQIVQAFNELKFTFNKLNIPVATTNIDPSTGKRVTMPMWKYRLDKMGINEKGFIKPDEFLPKPKTDVANAGLSNKQFDQLGREFNLPKQEQDVLDAVFAEKSNYKSSKQEVMNRLKSQGSGGTNTYEDAADRLGLNEEYRRIVGKVKALADKIEPTNSTMLPKGDVANAGLYDMKGFADATGLKGKELQTAWNDFDNFVKNYTGGSKTEAFEAWMANPRVAQESLPNQSFYDVENKVNSLIKSEPKAVLSTKKGLLPYSKINNTWVSDLTGEKIANPQTIATLEDQIAKVGKPFDQVRELFDNGEMWDSGNLTLEQKNILEQLQKAGLVEKVKGTPGVHDTINGVADIWKPTQSRVAQESLPNQSFYDTPKVLYRGVKKGYPNSGSVSGTWLTSDYKTAQKYAGEGGKVIEVDVTPELQAKFKDAGIKTEDGIKQYQARLGMNDALSELKNPRVAQESISDTAKVGQQTPGLQTSKTLTQQSQVLKGPSEGEPQGLTQAGGNTGGSSSGPIISQKDKYAFNINKPKLGLTGESAKKLDETVAKMRPILETRKGKPLTDKEIITSGRKAKLLETVMGRDDSAKFAEALQASRNFLKSESSKKGLTPEFLAQIEIVSSHASDKGRSLRAFAVDAENAGIKEQVIKDLGKLGISTKRLIDAAKNVDWDNAQQVTEFYRKFKPAGFLEMLEEYRYANMLSSPNTQINNIFSNFLQSGVVTPVEKTLTGSLDFARSRLTGKEQKYFASQGIDYAKGYWGSLPQAWKIFRGVLKGDGGLSKPDIDFIPTGTGKIHKLYTTPLRALEAGDQFFRTLVAGGEIKSLQRAGITGVEATNKAEAEATYRMFRQAFDPDGKLGQGGVLKVWDKWNVGINHLRRLPGGKWIVPFLQTPTNILKQGVEYSPLGFSTIPGSKEPMVQLSKALLGSGVFVGAYSLADAGLTTWDTPINKKDKDAFYEAGLQPYSVKIGDKWVSYSKLGPISYPIAMASAMKWAKDNGSDDNALKTAGAGMGGFLQFFADQSYMQGIGDVIDAVRGDEWKQGRALANIPSQLIPYRALQGWITRLTDPVYRKVSNDGILGQAVDSIKSQVPFASKTLDPYTNSKGEESRRSNPLINAISPFKISEELSPYMPKSTKAIYYEFGKLETQQEKAALWEQMVKDKRITKNNISDLKQHFLDEKLKITDKDIDIRNEGVADGSRARSIYNQFNKLETPQEKAELWNKYVKAKIITKDVAKQLRMLLQN